MADESESQSPNVGHSETPHDTPADKQRGVTDMKGPATQPTRDAEPEQGEGTLQEVQPVVTLEAPQDNTITEEEQKAAALFDRLAIGESSEEKVEQTPSLLPASSVLLNVEQTTTATPSRPHHHLEAYILRPHSESLGDTMIWSTKIELLHFDEAAMRAHLKKLGPGYSVIDSIAELLPEQLRLIQERTKSRDGRLVSVQQGASVDMVTQIGTFKVKSVFFVITIATLPEKKDIAEDFEVILAKAKEAVQKLAPDIRSSLFEAASGPSNSLATNNNNLFSAVTAAKKSENAVFRGFSSLHAPKPEPTSITSSFRKYGPVSATPYGAPSKPAVHSQDNGTFVPFEEQDGIGNAKNRYMTITFNIPYQNTSFEELRVTDYAAGRTEPTKVAEALNSATGWVTRKFSDDKPFGGQYIKSVSGFGTPAALSATPNVPRPSTDGLSLGTRSGGGLFSGFGAPTQPNHNAKQWEREPGFRTERGSGAGRTGTRPSRWAISQTTSCLEARTSRLKHHPPLQLDCLEAP
jgi:hypothetical protein